MAVIKKKVKAAADGEILAYIRGQGPGPAKICAALREAISSALPGATAKLYHSSPAWFIGENAVVGFSANAKGGVTLLFWNGQAFDEPGLRAVGKFKAAQVGFGDISEIDEKNLRRWLKKAGKDVWDFAGWRKRPKPKGE